MLNYTIFILTLIYLTVHSVLHAALLIIIMYCTALHFAIILDAFCCTGHYCSILNALSSV